MQLNFTCLPEREKLPRLQALKKAYLMVVVRCGSCQIIHYGTLDAINGEGTIIALNCFSERHRNEYTGQSFTQHERLRKPSGELIKPSERWQYVPIELIDKVICLLPNFSE